MLTVPQEEHETNTTPENMRPRILDWPCGFRDIACEIRQYGDALIGYVDGISDGLADTGVLRGQYA